jgi:hypothetical protein
MLFLDPLLGVMVHDTKVTRLGVMTYDAELSDELTTKYVLAADVA